MELLRVISRSLEIDLTIGVKLGLDVALALDDILLQELANHLYKFFFVLKKKNGHDYPSHSVMSIYKGINRIFCAVQTNKHSEFHWCQ